MTTRMVLKGTQFQEECFKDIKGDYGIFLDLYCFDYLPDDEKKRNREIHFVWLEGKLMILAAIGKPVLYLKGKKADFVSFVCGVFHAIFHFLHITPYSFYKMIKKSLLKNGKPSKQAGFLFETKPGVCSMAIDEILPVRRMPFEDMEINVPAKIEQYLARRFGDDYMQLPPEEKRHNHPPYFLNFGE